MILFFQNIFLNVGTSLQFPLSAVSNALLPFCDVLLVLKFFLTFIVAVLTSVLNAAPDIFFFTI